jgi:hypothetical protein
MNIKEIMSFPWLKTLLDRCHENITSDLNKEQLMQECQNVYDEVSLYKYKMDILICWLCEDDACYQYPKPYFINILKIYFFNTHKEYIGPKIGLSIYNFYVYIPIDWCKQFMNHDMWKATIDWAYQTNLPNRDRFISAFIDMYGTYGPYYHENITIKGFKLINNTIDSALTACFNNWDSINQRKISITDLIPDNILPKTTGDLVIFIMYTNEYRKKYKPLAQKIIDGLTRDEIIDFMHGYINFAQWKSMHKIVNASENLLDLDYPESFYLNLFDNIDKEKHEEYKRLIKLYEINRIYNCIQNMLPKPHC